VSTTTLDQDKADLIEKAIDLARARKGHGGPPHETVDVLLPAYYRHVAPEDVIGRADVDLYGALASHWRLAGDRPQGTARVRVFTPSLAEHGWSAGGHTVVEVVTDDMPFLVDSLTMELARQQRSVHVVVHPHFDVCRDITGGLEIVAPVADGSLEPEGSAVRESWMHVEIDRVREGDDTDAIEQAVQRVLRDVRESVEDWEKMHAQVEAVVQDLERTPPPLPAEEIAEGSELLTWLAADHFTFLGYREYRLEPEPEGGAEWLRAVPGTGLGILRTDPDMSASSGRLPEAAAAKAREKTLLVLTKANSRATVHRPAYLDYVGVKTFEDGEVVGERRFLGLFSSAAYTESLTRIPLLREKAAAVLRESGFDPRSHAGKALMDTLETYPRDELFHTAVEELAPMAEASMLARERRQLRVFVRRDSYGRYVSVLVYLPRDRYNTAVRERFARILKDRLGGESVEFTVRVNESTTARVHFVVRPPEGGTIGDIDTVELERRLGEASRSWRDDFIAAVVAEYGEEAGTALGRRYVDSFPEAYKEDFGARTGAVDLGRLEGIEGQEGIALSLYEQMDADRGEARLKIFRIGPPLSLSEVLPMLSSMGAEVIDERPYELEGLGRPTYVYEFGLRYGGALPDHARELFQDALRAVWDGFNEIDGFNTLVLGAGLTWRQATVLRAYAKYMRQGNSPFALDYIEEALASNVDITRLLVNLFEARFDPGRDGLPHDAEARTARIHEVEERITRTLDDVASLDQDRILRSYLTHIRATLRTNYFQAGAGDTGVKPYLSFKLEPSAIPGLPEPRPRFEIFVYSPRVEGVHLRFGAVARGGLRWSDRRDDFRTEVLGLVKAQMVKNTVIVPVGAKGGFFCKQLPEPGQRDAWLAEGIACYKTFICGLLDITDNLVEGETVPPERVVRHDGDDSYLVVAADKGTATFSDIANGVAHDYGFWLGDAFASGGSVGYDHKAMGITARGAWVSVQRHFRERRVRQRDALLRAHPAGGGLRPPRHLPGPRPRRRRVVRRAAAAVRAGPLELAGLRPGPDLRRRRCLPAVAEVDPAERRGAAGPRHRRRRRRDDARRADARHPHRARRPALERRDRHLREGVRGEPRRRRRQVQRRDPGRRPRAAGDLRRRGRQPRPDPARPHRVRPARLRGTRWPDEHGLHRQLRRRGHLRPRGQPQDPARPGRGRRRPHRQAAQHAARRDDRRGRGPGAARQLRAEPRPRERRRERCPAAARARGLDEEARGRRGAQPRAGGPAAQA
jgi:glutamate dehydrogenase